MMNVPECRNAGFVVAVVVDAVVVVVERAVVNVEPDGGGRKGKEKGKSGFRPKL